MTLTFAHQWKDEKGRWKAMPHHTTTNKSFLRTASLFRKMNIKNFAFPLALYDPDLLHVNVHDLEEDTPENELLRRKVMIEARRNGWYFLRECIRIYEQGGSPVSFRLDRGSAAMAWCFFNGIDYTGMQPRQAQPLDALIRTPTGWSTMGDMTIGKDITAPDGKGTKIKGVYPQGLKDVYKVTFEDGRSTECCDDHLWKVNWSHWGEADGGKWRVYNLKDIRMHMQCHEFSKNRLYVPLIEPEQKDDIDLPIDPYLLGVMLGDGAIHRDSVNICKPDQFIKDEVSRLLPSYMKVSDFRPDGKSFRLNLNESAVEKSIRRHNKTKPKFIQDLIDLGLMGTHHNNKFIPQIYMNASPRQKLSLIQGLMDTDGTVETPRFCKDGITKKHGSIEYSTTSSTLANQFQELIRSLGGLCKLSDRQTYYTYNGEKLPGKISYRVNPRVRDRSSLFRLPRKRDLATFGNYKYQDNLKLAIRSIEYIGKKETQCIEVDHLDHLYITNDYIVTHNTGKTVCALSLLSWILYSSGEEFTINALAKDNNLRQENVKRIKIFGENLPSWWIATDARDKKNSEEIYIHSLKTHYVTYVAQSEKSSADKQGRGASAPVIHVDELYFCNNIGITYPTMLASTGTARENAKKNGKPHSNIITTTAGDPTKPECREAAKILEKAMPFTEHLYDLENNKMLHEVVKAASAGMMIIGVFSHLQLGYDNEWLRDKINRNRMTRDQVMRDYLNRCVSIQEEPIIPKETLALINSSQRDVDHIQMLSSKFAIYWYISKEIRESAAFKQKPIIVGCDSSEMIGRDSTTLVGIDPTDLGVVFTFRCNEGNINVVGAAIADFLLKFPKMIFVPENKSSGTSIIDSVAVILRRESHNPFKRIFNWVVNNKHEKEFADIDIRDMSLIDSKVRRYFGIKTDKTKRDELYSTVLIEGATLAARRIRDQNLIGELNSLTVRNGRVDHASGGHDDTVIAFLMAMYFILNAKNLHVYGINPGTNMSRLDNPGHEKARADAERQSKIRDKIDELKDKLKYQTDVGLQKLLEADLRMLTDMVDDGPLIAPQNADELLRDPRRFVDSKTSMASRTPVRKEELESSLKALLNMR